MKKLRKLFILLAVIAIIAMVVVIVMLRKNKVIVNDYTVLGVENAEIVTTSEKIEGEIISHEEREDVAEASFSSLVKVISGDDANKVNASITKLHQNGEDISLTINAVGKDVFQNMGIDDIFVLAGNEETPFGMVYFGKITSKYTNNNGDLVVNTTNPELYEVFDEMYVDAAEVLTPENIRNVQTFDGVTYKFVDNIETELQQTSNHQQELQLDNMVTMHFHDEKNELDVNQVASFDLEKSASILFDVNVKAEYDFNKKKWETAANVEADLKEKRDNILNSTKLEEDSEKEGSINYSLKNDEKEDADKIDEKLDSSWFSTEEERKLKFAAKGKLGFEDIGAKVHIDFSIFNGGFRDFNAAITGNSVFGLDFLAQFTGKVGGEKTKAEIEGFDVSGLNQKLFPIAYFDFFTKKVSFPGSVYQDIGEAPMSVGAMVYIDASGELKIYTSLTLERKHSFTKTINLVQDGQIVSSDEMVKTTSIDSAEIKWDAGIKGSIELDIPGFSVVVNVGNLNAMSVDLFQLVVKAEGSAIFSADASKQSSNTGPEQEWKKNASIEASASVKGEMQFFSVAAKLKIKGWNNKALINIDLKTEPLYTGKLFEFGTESSTKYDSSTQKYGKVSATNGKYAIYINEYGNLVRKNRETQDTKTYDIKGVEMICGIDETYLYVLQENAGHLDLYRLVIEDKKEKYDDATNNIILPNTKDKAIATDVKEVLLENDRYLYYIENDATNTIRRINRATLSSTAFCTISNVEYLYMDKTSSGFYVVAKDPSQSWLTFLGESDVEYYNLDERGNIVSKAEPLYTQETEYSYKIQVQYTGHSLLRNSASDYNLVAENGQVIDLPTTIGWEHREIGIFTVEENSNQTTTKENILYLYKKEDGEKVKIATLRNKAALWTVIVKDDELIYYVDEDENGNKVMYEVVLGTTSESRPVRTFSQNEFNVNLDNCSSEISDETLYFYSIIGDNNLEVQYRH